MSAGRFGPRIKATARTGKNVIVRVMKTDFTSKWCSQCRKDRDEGYLSDGRSCPHWKFRY